MIRVGLWTLTVTALVALLAGCIWFPMDKDPDFHAVFANKPAPPDSASVPVTNVKLTWSCTVWRYGRPWHECWMNQVFLGDSNPPPMVRDWSDSLEYNTGSLLPNHLYYWRIASRGDIGLETEYSPVWCFTTFPGDSN